MLLTKHRFAWYSISTRLDWISVAMHLEASTRGRSAANIRTGGDGKQLLIVVYASFQTHRKSTKLSMKHTRTFPMAICCASARQKFTKPSHTVGSTSTRRGALAVSPTHRGSSVCQKQNKTNRRRAANERSKTLWYRKDGTARDEGVIQQMLPDSRSGKTASVAVNRSPPVGWLSVSPVGWLLFATGNR